MLRLLSLDPATAALSALGDALATDVAPGLRHPVAARRFAPDEWILSWSTAGAEASVGIQRWTLEGVPVGGPRALLASSGTFNEPLLALAGSGGDGARVFAYDTEADSVVRAAARCGE
ncbi:MAG: hypothetical protein AB8I08_14815 [Sandaracinaceae bacterium]